MQRLSLLIILSFFSSSLIDAQSPHGDNLNIDCLDCHTTDGWIFDTNNSQFTHDDVGFSLDGQHQNTDCKLCHTSLVFDEAASACVSCHMDVHNTSAGNDCARCHDALNWLVDNIPELHEQNGFPLLGQHRMAACVDCHKSENNLIWNRIGNECISCHLDNYMATTSPNHQTSSFSTNCTECHNPGSQRWSADNFHYYFPLVGRHDIQDCAQCHDVNNFSLATPECISCHRDNYEGVTSPNHVTLAFSVDCNQCHSGDSWIPATFDHDMFPLVGRHDIQDCAQCHDVNNYSSASSECISCHRDDYNNVTSPNHLTSGFSENCNLCHTGDSWLPASFSQHDSQYFPIFSGEHNNEWNTCDECHTGSDYTTFSCIICHNNQGSLANEHDEESGYVYESNACYNCHPTGEKDD